MVNFNEVYFLIIMLITSAKITLILVSSKLLWRNLRPEFFFVRGLHVALAFGAGVLVPGADLVAATVEAQTSCLAAKGGGDIADDATYDDILNRLAVRTTHG